MIVKAFEEIPGVQGDHIPTDGRPRPGQTSHSTPNGPAMSMCRANVLLVLSRYYVLGYQLTLLEVHKLLYFLQVAGEDLSLRFTKEAYGPYADNLRHVLKFEGHFTSE